MTQVGTGAGTALVATSPRGAFSGGFRGAPRAAFISQLIAERQQMAIQRARRRAPVGEVLSTYDKGGRLAERRMPPGYRLSVEA